MDHVYVAKVISELYSKGHYQGSGTFTKKSGSLHATDIIITIGLTDILV